MTHPSAKPAYDYSKVPLWLRAAKRFVLFRLVPSGDGKKPKKVPYYINGTPRKKTDVGEDVAQLATFEDALAALQARLGAFDGLGFALGPDGAGGYFQGIDLDDVPTNAYLEGEVALLKGYVEQSPSGRGYHAIGYGPEFGAVGSDGSGVEAYCRGRFFTVTGLAISDSGPEDLSGCVGRLMKYRVGHNSTLVARAVPTQAAWDTVFEVTEVRARELRSALAYLDPDPYENWISIAYAMKGGGEAAFEIWSEWAARSAKYDPEDSRRVWNKADPQKTSVGAVFKRAEAAGWPNPRKVASAPTWALDRAAANDDHAEPSFHFKSAGELLEEIAPPKYLIDKHIEEGAIGLLFGEPGLGKSFLAIDWACCVATGTPWLGHLVRSGPVFYIAGEGHGGMGRRLAAWNASNDADLSSAPVYVSTTAASFMDVDSAGRVSAAVERLATDQHPKLVVIDTLHRNLGGGDENSAEDVAAFLTHVDLFIRKKFGCTVLIVHHSGHADKSRARGSSSIAGAMDFIMRLSGESARLRLTSEKQKDGEPPEELHLKLQQVDLTFLSSASVAATSQIVVASCPPDPTDSLSATLAGRTLLAAIQEGGEQPPAELGLAADVDRVTREETWRKRYLTERGTGAAKPESLSKDFARKKKVLLESGLIFEREGWVWVQPHF